MRNCNVVCCVYVCVCVAPDTTVVVYPGVRVFEFCYAVCNVRDSKCLYTYILVQQQLLLYIYIYRSGALYEIVSIAIKD